MRPFAPALFLLLGACAGLGPDTLPVCDGQARRPANPHGSVLSPPTAPPPGPSLADRTAAPGARRDADPGRRLSTARDLAAGGCA